MAKFDEKVSAEAHAEIGRASSKGSEHQREPTEKTIIPAGTHMLITQTRERSDGIIPVSGKAEFSHNVLAGSYNHHHCSWNSDTVHWDSWEQFCDCVNGEAPDNWPMAREFKDKAPFRADLWALKPLNEEVKYTIKFEGREAFKYKVEKISP